MTQKAFAFTCSADKIANDRTRLLHSRSLDSVGKYLNRHECVDVVELSGRCSTESRYTRIER